MNPSEDLKKLAKDLASTQKKALSAPEAESFDSYGEFMDYLNGLGVAGIVAVMNDYPSPMDWYPKGWSYLDWPEGYPKILARALVQSTEKESITDLTNMYYARNNLSPEAIAIFKQDVLGDPAKTLEFMTVLNYMPPGLSDLAEHDTSFAKSLLMMLNDDQMKEHIAAVKATMGVDEAAGYFKTMGINPEDYV